MAGGTRKREMHVSSSWRMVEGGENDSFDTSVLHDDEDLIISSGSDPSQFSGSQPFSLGGSQPFSINGSQDDNIEDFLRKAEDEQVIMRTPFRPSIPQSVRHQSREAMRHRSPEPEFYMPTVEVESPRRNSNQSSRTVRAVPPTLPGLRRRQQPEFTDSPTKSVPRRKSPEEDVGQQKPFIGRLSEPLPGALFNALAWFFGLVGLAFRYAQKPLAIMLAIYFVLGSLIVVQNMATRSIYTSLSPICRLPGVSWLDLPFCPDIMPKDGREPGKARKGPVEFDSLMSVQENFEGVLEKSADGVSLPLEMKRSETSVRDLRTVVSYSQLQDKAELVLEFDGFIDTARKASTDLQKFNTHVGSAVDSVIAINRWTSRYLDGLANEDNNKGLISNWASWLFSPFQPAIFSEHHIRDKYIEHTALVSDKIADLIVEAQAVLRTLEKAEGHLEMIAQFVHRTEKVVQEKKDEILWTLWRLVGGHRQRLHNLDSQLTLLRQVGHQRSAAVKQVGDLVNELVKIQAGLDDLRDRVAEPELARGRAHVALSVHVDTINRGVERLEVARGRIRDIENEKIREVLARGKDDGNLIESS